jgi:prepilin-type N-terminal cleavage/methylation domain-containing protein
MTPVRRQGFTLAEVLIAMTLMAIIILSVVSMLITQTRFLTRVSGDIATLDRVNPVMDMLATEIASLPPSAIVTATADRLIYRLPLQWGVICGPVDRATKTSGGKKKSKTANVTYSSVMALALEPEATALGSPTPDGFGLSPNGRTFTYRAITWSNLGLSGLAPANASASDSRRVASEAAGVACLNSTPPLPAGNSGNFRNAKSSQTVRASQIGNIQDYRQSTGLVAQNNNVVPAERSLFVAFQLVEYRFESEGTSGRRLVRITSATTNAQRLGGPYASTAGFSFLLTTSDAPVTEVTGTNDLDRIRAIRANLPARRVQRGAVAEATTQNVQPWLYLINAR